MLENSDDYDFNPANSSMLASLFGSTSINSESDNSLIYKAPKPPGSGEIKKNIESKETKSSVVIGKVVLLWKLQNKEYATLGKHGLAIIGSSDKNIYELIGYKEKTNILFRIRLSNNFTFHNQKDNFSTFYDSDSSNWLVRFENKDQIEFTTLLKTYGVNMVNSLENSQESISKLNDDTIPVTISSKPDLPHKPLLINADNDSHSDSSASKQKANILNRMARMGQAILPKSEIKNTSTELSDSDVEDKRHERRLPPRQVKRVAAEKATKQFPIQKSNVESKLVPEINNFIDKYQPLTNEMLNSQNLANQQFSGQIFNPQMMSNQMYHHNWANDGYSQYIIAQNTELKMNIAQISAKLDNVLDTRRIDNDETADRITLLSRLKTMKLKSENLEAALQKSEEKIFILRTNYDKLERVLANANKDESKNKEIEILENTISDLKIKLQETLNKYEVSRSELEIISTKSKDLEEIITAQNGQIKELEEHHNINKLNETIFSLNDTIDILKLKQKDFEEYFEKSESEKKVSAQTNNNKIKIMEDFVKRQMNEMYQSILENFAEDGSYKFSDIQIVVSKNLKSTSFKIIQDCINTFKESNVFEE